ncbi:MAG: flagellar filament capping protein FliD [Gammaproteobacteria bacterium]|nr:flagellar filament capping protein FliD [Gammaproteobacteria bacterium]
MAGISVSGVGSGIDINSLVNQLVASERQPTVQRLDRREAGLQAELSGFSLLKSALADLQSALDGLGGDGLFQGRSVTSAAPEQFTATAQGGAATGSFAIEVERLASAQKLRSTGFSGPDAIVGTGTLTIAGGDSSFTVDAGDGSLGAIRDAINEAADNTLVSAGIVNVDDGTGGTESRLVLTAREPGSANALTVTTSDGDGDSTDATGLSRLVYDPQGSGATQLIELDPAEDALIRIDGQAATRSANTVDDLIDGVTLELLSADPGNPATLTIGEDTGAAGTAVNAFVTAFNGFAELRDSLTGFDPDTRRGGPLLGDSTLRILDSRLRSTLFDRVGAAGEVNSLAALGITTGDDGRLTVNNATLTAALDDNPAAVAALFGGETGLVARAGGMLDGFLQNNGLLDNRIDGLNGRIEDIGDRRLNLDRRIDALESRLLAQFTAMDQLVSQLQNTGNFLTQQLENIPVPGRTNR